MTSAVFQKKDEQNNSQNPSAVYNTIASLCQMCFGALASLIVMGFSRHREYRADAGSAHYLGKECMIKALRKLQQLVLRSPVDNRASAFNAMKISMPGNLGEFFSTHPPLEKRIEAL